MYLTRDSPLMFNAELKNAIRIKVTEVTAKFGIQETYDDKSKNVYDMLETLTCKNKGLEAKMWELRGMQQGQQTMHQFTQAIEKAAE